MRWRTPCRDPSTTRSPGRRGRRCRGPCAASLVHPVEAVVDGVEGVGAVLGDDHDVLDAHPPLALDVDAGLDREGVADGEPVAVAADQVGVLMLLEADAVAGAVNEVVAVAALGDD